jgi:hypothetical protein
MSVLTDFIAAKEAYIAGSGWLMVDVLLPGNTDKTRLWTRDLRPCSLKLFSLRLAVQEQEELDDYE